MQVTPEWMKDGLCVDAPNPDLWFPSTSTRYRDIAAAKKLCEQCPVQKQCLSQGYQFKAKYGIFGGRTFGVWQEDDTPYLAKEDTNETDPLP